MTKKETRELFNLITLRDALSHIDSEKMKKLASEIEDKIAEFISTRILMRG